MSKAEHWKTQRGKSASTFQNSSPKTKIKKHMLKTGEESYEFIGQLAIALYTQKIKLRLSALQKILNDKGANYSAGRGMGKVVSAAYAYWKNKNSSDGWVIHHAIAASFTGKNDEYLF
jgi:hypothetical protein